MDLLVPPQDGQYWSIFISRKTLLCSQEFFVLFCNCILCISSAQPPVSTFPSPEIGKGKLTVGKIYGGLLILENWKTTKFGKIPNSQRPVNMFFFAINLAFFCSFFNRKCCTKSVIIVTFHPQYISIITYHTIFLIFCYLEDFTNDP